MSCRLSAWLHLYLLFVSSIHVFWFALLVNVETSSSIKYDVATISHMKTSHTISSLINGMIDNDGDCFYIDLIYLYQTEIISCNDNWLYDWFMLLQSIAALWCKFCTTFLIYCDSHFQSFWPKQDFGFYCCLLENPVCIKLLFSLIKTSCLSMSDCVVPQ